MPIINANENTFINLICEHPNLIWYNGSGGHIGGDGELWRKSQSQRRLKEGDTLLMSVSTEKGEIFWQINE